ncbi:MAG TPA: hypothetical protein ENN29_02810 [Candidatus Hydrogenedentes bacterium]|nr:hypothetical protein [Candidatus Hydrogenedentota bacterium]
MPDESDIKIIRDLSKNYHVKRVFLFGSNLARDTEARDIDLAVEGVAPETFFDYYGDLMMQLSKPVDLVDISAATKFNKLILREGAPVYKCFKKQCASYMAT